MGGISYLYDKNGNLIDVNNGQYEYSYDCENRLIDVNEDGNSVASYSYDYQGRRVSKTVYDTNGQILTTTHYTYDGYQVIAEYEGESLVRKFIYGPGIDEPICMIDIADGNTVLYYYHFDGVGSVIALSDVNSVIVERYSYDVFGEPNTTSSLGNPYLFTGRRLDNETGLYYYRARYYAHDIGRFLQTDPIGYDDGLNMYTYVGNNPLNWIDPWGLCEGKDENDDLMLLFSDKMVPRPEWYPQKIHDYYFINLFDHINHIRRYSNKIILTGFPGAPLVCDKPSWWPYPPRPSGNLPQKIFEEILSLALGRATGIPIVGANPTELGDSTLIGAAYRRTMREEQERIEGERAWLEWYTGSDPRRHERISF